MMKLIDKLLKKLNVNSNTFFMMWVLSQMVFLGMKGR